MTIEQSNLTSIASQVKNLKKEKDYCCTQITYQLAGLDPLGLEDEAGQKALRAMGWGVRTQRNCGALTGGAMALALHIDDKEKMIKAVQEYTDWFMRTFHHANCGDLLGWGKGPDGTCHDNVVTPCVHKLLDMVKQYQ